MRTGDIDPLIYAKAVISGANGTGCCGRDFAFTEAPVTRSLELLDLSANHSHSEAGGHRPGLRWGGAVHDDPKRLWENIGG